MTAQEIIEAALRKVGVISRGYTLPAEEAADGLEALNNMLRAWENDDFIIPYTTTENFSMVVGQESYTVGSGGNFDTTQPIEIHRAWVRVGDYDYPLRTMNDKDYALDQNKLRDRRPQRYWYERGLTTGTLTLDSEPDTTDSIYLVSLKPFTTFAALTTEDSLQDSYLEAVTYNLGVRLASEYGKEPSPSVVGLALDGYRALQVRNARIPKASVDRALRPSRRYDINQDYP